MLRTFPSSIRRGAAQGKQPANENTADVDIKEFENLVGWPFAARCQWRLIKILKYPLLYAITNLQLTDRGISDWKGF